MIAPSIGLYIDCPVMLSAFYPWLLEQLEHGMTSRRLCCLGEKGVGLAGSAMTARRGCGTLACVMHASQ